MGVLTAVKAKALKAPGRHTDGKGLHLYVKESGTKSWVLRTPVNGKRQDFGLGSFEDVSLAEARAKADQIRATIRAGGDPKRDKAEAKVAPRSITFREAAAAVHKEHELGWKNVKHRAQWLSSLEAYAFPLIGEVPVAEVEGPAIRDLLADIWLQKPETARRVRQRIGTVLDWAYAKGLRQSEAPVRSITRGLPRQPKKDNHFAALPHPEAPALFIKLASEESMGRLALRFLILTAARSGEVRLATWSEFDLSAKLWTVPSSHMKAGKTHVVPLSVQATEILVSISNRMGGDPQRPVFPGKNGNRLSDMTLTKVLRTNHGDKVTVHGFRSTFRDWAAEQTDYAGSVIEAALAHEIRNKVEAAYLRTRFLEKRRPLMQAWADYLHQESAL